MVWTTRAPPSISNRRRRRSVFLSFSDSELCLLARLHERGLPASPSLRCASLAQLKHPFSVDLYLDNVARRGAACRRAPARRQGLLALRRRAAGGGGARSGLRAGDRAGRRSGRRAAERGFDRCDAGLRAHLGVLSGGRRRRICARFWALRRTPDRQARALARERFRSRAPDYCQSAPPGGGVGSRSRADRVLSLGLSLPTTLRRSSRWRMRFARAGLRSRRCLWRA